MGDENQVVENSSEVVSEVVSENSTEVVKPVKVKKEKKVKNLELLLGNLSSEQKTIEQVIEGTNIDKKTAFSVLRTASRKNIIQRVKVQTESDKKQVFTYSKVD